MNKPGLYQMSDDGVYPSSVPSSPILRISSLMRLVPDPILEVEVTHCSIGKVGWCGPSGPKLVYRNSESVPKFEVRMWLPGLYR